MSFLRKLLNKETINSTEDLQHIRRRFRYFYNILDHNHYALNIISDMAEKAQGEYLFDINYIRDSLDRLRGHIEEIIDSMVELGGETYSRLIEKYEELNNDIERLFKKEHVIPKESFTKNFNSLTKDKIESVGSKNARLGEIKTKMDIYVPNGFAITTAAYKHFLDANNLQERISKRINTIDIKNYEDLEEVSSEIREMIKGSIVPDDLAREIRSSYELLKRDSETDLVSIRSSALGEDMQLSFAGQYETYLGVKEDEIIDRYRDVIASKFTPKAIFYFMSHSLNEAQLAMGVGCVEMIDTKTAGVIYTRDPVNPEKDILIINSVYGLGKSLVDGIVVPDIIHVSRETKAPLEKIASHQKTELLLNPRGGILEKQVPEHQVNELSIFDDEIYILSDIALKIEKHFGKPQDIEWAIDSDGTIYVMQARPLRLMKSTPESDLSEFAGLPKLAAGGTTVCPGGGSGPVYYVSPNSNLQNLPDGVVLVAENPFPGLITVLGKVDAFIATKGSSASHTATIAREFRTPTIFGMQDAKKLEPGQFVTVDATNTNIYDGDYPELCDALRPDFDYFRDDPLFGILESILTKISPLNLLNPDSPDFTVEQISTYHDIIRYVHQKSMKELFESTQTPENHDIGVYLKTEIPLRVKIIYIDKNPNEFKIQRWIKEDEIDSVPMETLWEGILFEGWPKGLPVNDMKGFKSVVGTNFSPADKKEYARNSFAILGQDFMIISLKMGYHFSTIEALCTDDVAKNYIKMQFKEGGAAIDRRERRVRLITEILKKMGFEISGREDFLDTILTNESRESLLNKLFILGRLSMLTKQLDMTLANDSITRWYTNEFIKKLGLQSNE